MGLLIGEKTGEGIGRRRIMNENTGTIFDIRRFSTHDGEGIRTTVFLKDALYHVYGAIILKESAQGLGLSISQTGVSDAEPAAGLRSMGAS